MENNHATLTNISMLLRLSGLSTGSGATMVVEGAQRQSSGFVAEGAVQHAVEAADQRQGQGQRKGTLLHPVEKDNKYQSSKRRRQIIKSERMLSPYWGVQQALHVRFKCTRTNIQNGLFPRTCPS